MGPGAGPFSRQLLRGLCGRGPLSRRMRGARRDGLNGSTGAMHHGFQSGVWTAGKWRDEHVQQRLPGLRGDHCNRTP